MLVDEDVDVRDRAAVFGAIARNFDPAEDFLLVPGVPLDTLDFTSYTMNLGSKMVLDAQAQARPRAGRAAGHRRRPARVRRAHRRLAARLGRDAGGAGEGRGAGRGRDR